MTQVNFNADSDGNLITNPITGWVALPLKESTVLLVIQFAENHEHFQTEGKSIQFVPTHPQCLLLSALLAKHAGEIHSQQ